VAVTVARILVVLCVAISAAALQPSLVVKDPFAALASVKVASGDVISRREALDDR
jgi:hypothetical protein